MSSALSIAAAGLQAAGRSFETAAKTVVAAGAAHYEAVAQPAPIPQSTPTQSPPVASPVFDVPDLAAGLVDLKLAEISYKAQIEVFKAASRLEEEALNLIA
jgi:hypothetical protein